MLAPDLSLSCLIPGVCANPLSGLGRSVGDGVANAAGSAVIDAVGGAMSNAADWLVGHVMDLISRTTTPNFGHRWFREEAQPMATVVAAVLLPILMMASIGPVLRQDGRRLLRVWGVGLPVAVLAGMAASQLAGIALSVTDSLCSVFLGHQSRALAGSFTKGMVGGLASGLPIFVEILLAMLTLIGTILVWLELMVRDAAVYVATFFMPLVLVAYIWPATAHMAKRGVEIMVSLILSKFVIVASLSLGLAAISGSGADATVAGAGILLLAGFAPFALMRLAPVVEAAAIGHLEGMAHRPGRAAGRAVTAAAAAPTHPVTQMLMSRSGNRSSAPATSASSVGVQFLREKAPDVPAAAAARTGGGGPIGGSGA